MSNGIGKNPLNDISKVYLEQVGKKKKKKDDSYLETDMKKRQENNEKAREDMKKMGTSMKNPHFEQKQFGWDSVNSMTKAYRAMQEGIRDEDPEKGTEERKKRLEKKRGMKLDDHPQYKKEEVEVAEAKADAGLTPLQKIRKRNKAYAMPGEKAGEQTSNRRSERASARGEKKEKGAKKDLHLTMKHVGGPYKEEVEVSEARKPGESPKEYAARMTKKYSGGKSKTYDPMKDKNFDHDKAERTRGSMDEAMSNYDRARKRAAQRAAERNAARAAGKTGVVPGVGYVSPRKERETYVDSAGTTRHKSGAKMEEVENVEEGKSDRPLGVMHQFARGMKQKRGAKRNEGDGKYLKMQHTKKQNKKEADLDAHRERQRNERGLPEEVEVAEADDPKSDVMLAKKKQMLQKQYMLDKMRMQMQKQGKLPMGSQRSGSAMESTESNIDEKINPLLKGILKKTPKGEDPEKGGVPYKRTGKMTEGLSVDDQMKISRDAAKGRNPNPDHKAIRGKMLRKPLPKDTRTDAQKMTDATGPRPGSRYRGD